MKLLTQYQPKKQTKKIGGGELINKLIAFYNVIRKIYFKIHIKCLIDLEIDHFDVT